MSIEVRWIEDLLTLERNKSFSKAAEQRFISQSAFTRRIQHIEEMVGADIVQRDTHHKIEFTEIGKLLLTVSKNIETQLKEAESLINNIKSSHESIIRFSVAHSLASGFLSNFLKKLPIPIQDFKIEILATNIDEGLSLLKEGSTDFMICYGHKLNDTLLKSNTLSYIKIAETEIVPVIAHFENNPHEYDIHEKFPLLTYSHNAYLRNVVDRLIQGKLKYKILYETDIANNLKELVLHGLGVAWLPKIIMQEELAAGKLKIINEPEYHYSQDILIVKNKFNNNKDINNIWNSLLNFDKL
ncbi:LysR substrate-binding domain-containing protein [Acinetobacter stercoris]|uniref:HTH-type transcriptional regulator YjiE n=1 Tax=Acinetobacter stercoris TaxID=2126983 RepID=A0A2U3N2I1_9GAMM|nr:LysR substrate-binding domain-containing protein [Acinetobacter stercoris]SPL71896.1 HTH-type transcriptional regulator YjiE [Acinetobacter stercoris]